MPTEKQKYSIQIVLILAVFSFVLFNLVFKLIVDYRSESLQKKAELAKEEQLKQAFIKEISVEYDRLLKLYQAKEYEKVIEMIKVFNQYGQSGYKDLPEIKKQIRLFYLKKKLEFLPRVRLDDYIKLSKDMEIKEDDSIEVFIRTPRYGQYFYTKDLPVVFEGVALSIDGDFSSNIVWSSSIDGHLGTGQSVTARLSVGTHEITATSTNKSVTGKMQTRVIIEKTPAFFEKYQRP